MLDAGRGGGSDCVESFDRVPQPDRRQYTLKGVEAETVELMRDAARKEGMKIGSWVSLRMKEAAQKALEAETLYSERTRADEHDAGPLLMERLFEAFATYKRDSDERLSRIERELHEVNSSQRAIMTSMLLHKSVSNL